MEFKFIDYKLVRDGKYLKNYELKYINKAGNEKIYEIVSHNKLNSIEDLGNRTTGVSILAICQGKMLLLNELRLGVNRRIYNLCAGMLEKDEKIEDCIARELMEESGLKLEKIISILPPAFAAVSLSDILNQLAIVEVSGQIDTSKTSNNEDILAKLYTKEEVKELLQTETFSSRAQLAAYMFANFDL